MTSRSSSWADDTFPASHPTNPDHQIKLSKVELQMIQRVRQCEAGAYTLLIKKTARGREGIHSFYMIEEGSERLTGSGK